MAAGPGRSTCMKEGRRMQSEDQKGRAGGLVINCLQYLHSLISSLTLYALFSCKYRANVC